MKTAQRIINSAKDSNEAIKLAENNSELSSVNQNWEEETTTFTFNDESILVINGNQCYSK